MAAEAVDLLQPGAIRWLIALC